MGRSESLQHGVRTANLGSTREIYLSEVISWKHRSYCEHAYTISHKIRYQVHTYPGLKWRKTRNLLAPHASAGYLLSPRALDPTKATYAGLFEITISYWKKNNRTHLMLKRKSNRQKYPLFWLPCDRMESFHTTAKERSSGYLRGESHCIRRKCNRMAHYRRCQCMMEQLQSKYNTKVTSHVTCGDLSVTVANSTDSTLFKMSGTRKKKTLPNLQEIFESIKGHKPASLVWMYPYTVL